MGSVETKVQAEMAEEARIGNMSLAEQRRALEIELGTLKLNTDRERPRREEARKSNIWHFYNQCPPGPIKFNAP